MFGWIAILSLVVAKGAFVLSLLKPQTKRLAEPVSLLGVIAALYSLYRAFGGGDLPFRWLSCLIIFLAIVIAMTILQEKSPHRTNKTVLTFHLVGIAGFITSIWFIIGSLGVADDVKFVTTTALLVYEVMVVIYLMVREEPDEALTRRMTRAEGTTAAFMVAAGGISILGIGSMLETVGALAL